MISLALKLKGDETKDRPRWFMVVSFLYHCYGSLQANGVMDECGGTME